MMKYAIIVSLFLLLFAPGCFPEECESLAISAITFDGDIGGDNTASERVWDVTESGALQTYWLGVRAAISLPRTFGKVDRAEVYATGFDQPDRETYVGVTASIVGYDPQIGTFETIGETVISRGGLPDELQTLDLYVEPEAYDWPETLLMVTSTGSPGERTFAGATLYRCQ